MKVKTESEVASVVSNSVRPHRRQPTRLPRPLDSPGKNTEWVGPKRLLGRPDEALGGGNQGPSAPGWGRQHHSQRDPPFVPSKGLPDWASLELSPSVESCGCGLGPSPVRLG